MTWMIAALVLLGTLVAVLCLAVAFLARKPRRPCYRCGTQAESGCDYMGLHYCHVCRDVVVMMLPAVQHDPPYGFPGSPGYLEFPPKG